MGISREEAHGSRGMPQKRRLLKRIGRKRARRENRNFRSLPFPEHDEQKMTQADKRDLALFHLFGTGAAIRRLPADDVAISTYSVNGGNPDVVLRCGEAYGIPVDKKLSRIIWTA